jgi:release factor glutamine methyltransferase
MWDTLERLKLEIPVRYHLLGRTVFLRTCFHVNDAVLVKAETEELVDWIISSSRTIKARRSFADFRYWNWKWLYPQLR